MRAVAPLCCTVAVTDEKCAFCPAQDAVSVGLAGIGDAAVVLSANVAAAGRVRVVLQNVASTSLLLPASTLRVVVQQYM